ncbi:MAG TPA: FecR domain-containing protein [Bacteroidales bacterium]|jgi:ferric-dicitrate binding protein FerR (iron transport regulator)|nr:FecR domain-containing protein [Bacteroidales bacterium]
MTEKMNVKDYSGMEYYGPGRHEGDRIIDVDRAWNSLLARINESPVSGTPAALPRFSSKLLKIAAALLVITGLGLAGLFISDRKLLSKKISVVTDINSKNLEVTLPDGSIAILNRGTVLSYRSNYGKTERKLSLSGEAFFEIMADHGKAFTIDAGKAVVKAVGTSFNVITSNPDSQVEVFVRTGKVLLSDNSGNNSILLDPGYIGTMDSGKPLKSLNRDPNYMAWNTGILVYDGQTLDIVFRDLKRVYNMEIIADDPSILKETWTSPINNQSQDTIIRLICYSFNLGYTKEGNTYHLSKR